MNHQLEADAGESSSETRRKRADGSNPSQLDAEQAAAHAGQLDVTQRPAVRMDEGRAAASAGLAPSTDTAGVERLRSPSPASPAPFEH